jgi:GT2 family glycosyltransferase
MSKVSIVTVTYNRAEQMKRGLSTILSQDNLPEELELVIVDDGSVDDTRNSCEELIKLAREKNINFQYIYLDHPEPRISCIPRNIGIKAAKGDIIIFTESETLHIGNTISQIIEYMGVRPNNTILASQVFTMGEKIYKSLPEEYFQNPDLIRFHKYAAIVSGNMQNTNAPDSDWAITGEMGCNAGVLFGTRKDWLLEIGGFDESFNGHGYDDFDLFNRLALIGHGVFKHADIAVIHQWHDKSFYKYNIYDAAYSNGKISEENIHKGIYKVNDGENWGL